MKKIVNLTILTLAFVITNCKKDDPQKDLISSKWYLEEIQFTETKTIDQVPGNLRNMNIEFSDSNRLLLSVHATFLMGRFIHPDPTQSILMLEQQKSTASIL